MDVTVVSAGPMEIMTDKGHSNAHLDEHEHEHERWLVAQLALLADKIVDRLSSTQDQDADADTDTACRSRISTWLEPLLTPAALASLLSSAPTHPTPSASTAAASANLDPDLAVDDLDANAEAGQSEEDVNTHLWPAPSPPLGIATPLVRTGGNPLSKSSRIGAGVGMTMPIQVPHRPYSHSPFSPMATSTPVPAFNNNNNNINNVGTKGNRKRHFMVLQELDFNVPNNKTKLSSSSSTARAGSRSTNDEDEYGSCGTPASYGSSNGNGNRNGRGNRNGSSGMSAYERNKASKKRGVKMTDMFITLNISVETLFAAIAKAKTDGRDISPDFEAKWLDLLDRVTDSYQQQKDIMSTVGTGYDWTKRHVALLEPRERLVGHVGTDANNHEATGLADFVADDDEVEALMDSLREAREEECAGYDAYRKAKAKEGIESTARAKGKRVQCTRPRHWYEHGDE